MIKLFSRNNLSFIKICSNAAIASKNGSIIQNSLQEKIYLKASLRGEIMNSLKQAKEDEKTNGVVLYGEQNFSHGTDIVELARGKHLAYPQLNEMIELIEDFNKPVLAYLSGSALGSGFELALGCHWRLASKNVQMGLTEATLGLLPSGGGTQRLPRVIGLTNAVDWIMTSKVINCDEALQCGLIDEIAIQDGELTEDDLVNWTTNFLSSDRVRNTPLKQRLLSSRSVPRTSTSTSPCILTSAGSFLRARILKACLLASDSNVSFYQGLEQERSLFTSILTDPQTKATLYHQLTKRRIERLEVESPQLLLRAKDIVNQMWSTLQQQVHHLLELGVSVNQMEIACSSIDFYPPLHPSSSPSSTSPSSTSPSTSPSSVTTLSDAEIIAFLLHPAINASLNSLAQELTQHPTPIDGSLVDYFAVHNGLFLSCRGGPMWYAEKTIKFHNLFKSLKDLSEKYSNTTKDPSATTTTTPPIANLEVFKPCELLESIAESGSSLTEELYFRKKSQKNS